jgi:uncharacterized BrkB/YihY/UPF0761 family membrane protein
MIIFIYHSSKNNQMKSLNAWLENPLASDNYGTATLTGLQFIIALAFIALLFTWCYVHDKKDRKLGRTEE